MIAGAGGPSNIESVPKKFDLLRIEARKKHQGSYALHYMMKKTLLGEDNNSQYLYPTNNSEA
jgi:hypothetical protein